MPMPKATVATMMRSLRDDAAVVAPEAAPLTLALPLPLPEVISINLRCVSLRASLLMPAWYGAAAWPLSFRYAAMRSAAARNPTYTMMAPLSKGAARSKSSKRRRLR